MRGKGEKMAETARLLLFANKNSKTHVDHYTIGEL